MGLFDNLKRLFASPTKPDPLFGQIRFQRAGFWEATVFFAPEDGSYEITIDGGQDRPTDTQRQFYREVDQRYPQLKEKITDLLLEQLQNWRPDFAVEDLWQWFALESFGIPDLDSGEHEWELIYELKDDGHLFCVMMDGWRVVGVRVDG